MTNQDITSIVTLLVVIATSIVYHSYNVDKQIERIHKKIEKINILSEPTGTEWRCYRHIDTFKVK